MTSSAGLLARLYAVPGFLEVGALLGEKHLAVAAFGVHHQDIDLFAYLDDIFDVLHGIARKLVEPDESLGLHSDVHEDAVPRIDVNDGAGDDIARAQVPNGVFQFVFTAARYLDLVQGGHRLFERHRLGCGAARIGFGPVIYRTGRLVGHGQQSLLSGGFIGRVASAALSSPNFFLFLTLRTEGRPSSAQSNLRQRRRAACTGLPAATVRLRGVAPAVSVKIDELPIGAAHLHRRTQSHFYGAGQSAPFDFRKRRRDPPRVDARREQRLIGVDVPRRPQRYAGRAAPL